MSDVGYYGGWSASAGSYGDPYEDEMARLSANRDILMAHNPWMAEYPDALLTLAQGDYTPDELVRGGAQMFGASYLTQMASSLATLTPAAQRGLYASLTPTQQAGLNDIGYKVPGKDDGGLRGAFGDLLGPPGELLGAGLSAGFNVISTPIKATAGATLDMLTWTADRVMNTYRAIRTMEPEAQVAALAGAVAGAALAPFTGGASLAAAAGVIGTSALAGAAVGATAYSVATGNPSDFFDAYNATWDGERTFSADAQRKAREILSNDAQLVNLAKDFAFYDLPDAEELATEIAGQRAGGPDAALAAVAKIAGSIVSPGTVEYDQLFASLSQIATSPNFMEAVKELRYGKISPGRDFARLVGLDEGTTAYNVVSGTADLMAQFVLDPFIIAGQVTKASRWARYGFNVGADDFRPAARIQQIYDRNENVRRWFDDVAASVEAGQYDAVRRFNPAAKQIYEMSREHAAEVHEAGRVFTGSELLDWFKGQDAIRQLLSGNGVVSGQRFLMMPHDEAQWMTTLRTKARDFVQGLDDGAMIRGRVRIERSGVTLDDIVDRLRQPADQHLFREAAPIERSATYEVGRMLGGARLTNPAMLIGRPLSAAAGIIEGTLNMMPRKGYVTLYGKDAPEELSRLVDMGRAAGLTSSERLAWKKILTGQENETLRRRALMSFYNDMLTVTGVRALPGGEDFAREFIEHFTAAYGVAGTDTVYEVGRLVKRAVLPSADLAHAVAIPDLKTMRTLVDRSFVLGKVLKVTDSNFVEGQLMRIWKPAVILRIGFIGRAAGEEGLAWMAREAGNGLIQTAAARSVARGYRAREARAAMEMANRTADAIRAGVDDAMLSMDGAVRDILGTLPGDWTKETVEAALKYEALFTARWAHRLAGRYAFARPVDTFIMRTTDAVRNLFENGLLREGGQVAIPGAASLRHTNWWVDWWKQAGSNIALGRERSVRRMLLHGLDPGFVLDARAFEAAFASSILTEATATGGSWNEVGRFQRDPGRLLVMDERGNPREVFLKAKGRQHVKRDGSFSDRWLHGIHEEAARPLSDEVLRQAIIDAHIAYVSPDLFADEAILGEAITVLDDLIPGVDEVGLDQARSAILDRINELDAMDNPDFAELNELLGRFGMTVDEMPPRTASLAEREAFFDRLEERWVEMGAARPRSIRMDYNSDRTAADLTLAVSLGKEQREQIHSAFGWLYGQDNVQNRVLGEMFSEHLTRSGWDEAGIDAFFQPARDWDAVYAILSDSTIPHLDRQRLIRDLLTDLEAQGGHHVFGGTRFAGGTVDEILGPIDMVPVWTSEMLRPLMLGSHLGRQYTEMAAAWDRLAPARDIVRRLRMADAHDEVQWFNAALRYTLTGRVVGARPGSVFDRLRVGHRIHRDPFTHEEALRANIRESLSKVEHGYYRTNSDQANILDEGTTLSVLDGPVRSADHIRQNQTPLYAPTLSEEEAAILADILDETVATGDPGMLRVLRSQRTGSYMRMDDDIDTLTDTTFTEIERRLQTSAPLREAIAESQQAGLAAVALPFLSTEDPRVARRIGQELRALVSAEETPGMVVRMTLPRKELDKVERIAPGDAWTLHGPYHNGQYQRNLMYRGPLRVSAVSDPVEGTVLYALEPEWYLRGAVLQSPDHPLRPVYDRETGDIIGYDFGASDEELLRRNADRLTSHVLMHARGRSSRMIPTTRPAPDGTMVSDVFQRQPDGRIVPLEVRAYDSDPGDLVTATGEKIDFGDVAFFQNADLAHSSAAVPGLLHQMIYPMVIDAIDDGMGWQRVITSAERADIRGAAYVQNSRRRVFASGVEDVSKVEGRLLPDYAVASMLQDAPKRDHWDRAVEWGFRKVVSPWIDAIVREPMALYYFSQARREGMAMRKWLVDPAVRARVADTLDLDGIRAAFLSEPVRNDINLLRQARGLDPFDDPEMAVRWLTTLQPTPRALQAEIRQITSLSRSQDVIDAGRRLSRSRLDAMPLVFARDMDDAYDHYADLFARLGIDETVPRDEIPLRLAGEGVRLQDRQVDALLDMKRAVDRLTPDIDMQAFDRAMANMMPFIDSHEIRSQFAEWARGLLPFWYAEENFLKRWGRSLTMDGIPDMLGKIRKGQLLYAGLASGGVVRTDPQTGRDMIVIPGTQALVDTIARFTPLPMVPVGTMFQMRTDQMLPGFSESVGRPQLGPLVSLPVDFMARVFPELAPIEEAVVGGLGVNRSVWEQVVPASLSRLHLALAGDESNARYASAMFATMQMLEAQDKGLPDNATADQIDDYIRTVRSHTRAVMMAQAITGFISPGAPSILQTAEGDTPLWQQFLPVGVEDPSSVLSARWVTLLRELGLTEGTAAFLSENMTGDWEDFLNVEAFAVSTSESVSGALLPATREGLRTYTDNEEWFGQFPMAGPWLLDDAGRNKSARDHYAYTQTFIDGLRKRRTPEEFLRAMKFKEASIPYFAKAEEFDLLLEMATSDEERRALSDQYDWWKSTFLAVHPIFAEELQGSGARIRREQTIQQMRTAMRDPYVPVTAKTEPLRMLMANYDSFMANLEPLNDDRSARAQEQKQRYKDAWENWATRFVLEHRELESFWISVLRPESRLT